MSVMPPVNRLLEICNPLKHPPWGCVRITIDEVLRGAKNRGDAFHPRKILPSGWSRSQHISRFRYYVLNGWSDPIDIDVGVPMLGCDVAWMIIDGNHRFAAAIVRKIPIIPASVSGDLDFAQELFGVDCAEGNGEE